MSDFGQLPSLANTASNGWFWAGMWYMIYIILILLFVGYGFEVAIVAASFVSMLIGIILVYAGLMAWEHMIVSVAILLFIFLYIIWSSSKGSN